MQNKSLLYIGNKLAGKGGTATTIDTLSKALEDEGYKVHSASSRQNKILRLLDMLWTTFKYGPKVNSVLIDTYSTQNFYYAVSVANLCRLLRIRYIPILHGGNLPKRLIESRSLSSKLFGGAYRNVAPSMYLYNNFKENGFENIVHISNTIILKDYPFNLRSKVRPRLLWVRSFSEVYNPKMALKVIESLIKKGFDPELIMIGPEKDGSLAECKRLAKEKKLPVEFTGKLSKKDWTTLSESCDIFLNTTNYDNLPVSLIEAMALGLPIVSTNVGGISYLIDNEKTGLLVDKNDTSSMTQAVIRLLKDVNLCESISENARKKSEEFDWEYVKHKWFQLLNG